MNIHEHRFALPSPALFTQPIPFTPEQAQIHETAWDGIVRAAAEEWVAVRKQRKQPTDTDLEVFVLTIGATMHLPAGTLPPTIPVQMAAAIEIRCEDRQ